MCNIPPIRSSNSSSASSVASRELAEATAAAAAAARAFSFSLAAAALALVSVDVVRLLAFEGETGVTGAESLRGDMSELALAVDGAAAAGGLFLVVDAGGAEALADGLILLGDATGAGSAGPAAICFRSSVKREVSGSEAAG